MNMNCCTNSTPEGKGGRSADIIVFPVRIIMSPTCSSRFFVGRKTRSAAALTTLCAPPRGDPTSPRATSGGRKPTLSPRGCQGGSQPVLARQTPWYVQPALEARRALGILGSASAVMLAACGSQPRQDENEPKGDYKVEGTRASFPEQQKLAKRSDLAIPIRNAGDKTIPNLAVTVNGFDRR